MASRPRLHSVSVRLLGLILAIAVPVASVMAYSWWQALQEGRTLALALLRADLAGIERELQLLGTQSNRVLGMLAARPDFRALDPGACNQVGLLRAVNPAYLELTVWSRDGQIVCTSAPQRGLQPDAASFNTGLSAEGLHVSNLYKGRITGRPLVRFTFPIRDAAGTTQGLIAVPVDLDYVEQLLQAVTRREGSAIGVVDRDSVVLARVPDNAIWRGKSARGTISQSTPLQPVEGVLSATGLDGVVRIVAFKVVQGMGMRVFVGAPESVLLSGFHDQLRRGALLFSLIVGVSLLAAALIARAVTRPLSDLVGVADDVAIGVPGRRARTTGLTETDRLATHMNSMIEARTSAEASLKVANRRLHEISLRLLRAEEDQRRLLARELHDVIGQELTALSLDVKLIGRRGQATPEVLARCEQAVARLLEQVRDVTLLLRPPQLDDLGLVAALRGHVERHVTVHGLQVHFEGNVDSSTLDADLAGAMFRIAQEALTNVLRHARAKNVWIGIADAAGDVVLTIKDDGIGLPSAGPSGAPRPPSSGVVNMRDRAELAGGALEMRTPGDGGTLIVARWPRTREAVAA